MRNSILVLFIIASFVSEAQVTTANKFKPNLVLLTAKHEDLKGKVKEFTKQDVFIDINGRTYTETKTTVNELKIFFDRKGNKDSTQMLENAIWKTVSRKTDNKNNEKSYILDDKNRVLQINHSNGNNTKYTYKELPDGTTEVTQKTNYNSVPDTLIINKENQILRHRRAYPTGNYGIDIYTYDSKGNIATETSEYYSNNELHETKVTTYRYTYDKYGNWTILIKYYNGKLPNNITKRSFKYWD